MIDINREISGILSKIDGVMAVFYHPEKFNKLPVISYYEIGTITGASWDNAEQAQVSLAAVDIWAKSGAKCADIAVEACRLLQAEGWTRDFCCDLPPDESGICHKHMRFRKQIFFE